MSNSDDAKKEKLLDLLKRDASVDELDIFVECLEIARSSKKSDLPIETTIEWIYDSNTQVRGRLKGFNDKLWRADLVGLVSRVWSYIIAAKKGNPSRDLGKTVESVRGQKWYRNSRVRSEFQNLCLSGCGATARHEISPKYKGKPITTPNFYCGDKCRKAFWKWIKEQTEETHQASIDIRVTNRVTRLRQRLKKQEAQLSSLEGEPIITASYLIEPRFSAVG